MAFVDTQVNVGGHPMLSLGPIMQEFHTFTAASGDTSGTITAKGLHRVDHVLVLGGVVLSAQPTVSGLTVTLAFNDPVATVAGQVMLYGR